MLRTIHSSLRGTLPSLRGTLRAIACTAIVAVASGFGHAGADDSMQTGDGLLMIKAAMPEQARVGESFTYNVEVINASDNVVLHNVKLKQSKAKGFIIESVSMQGKSGNCEDCGEDQNQSSQQESKSKNNSTSEKQSGSDQSQSKGKSKDSMIIKQLGPGESRTFVVHASADEEGELRSCLQIASYTPAMCLTSQIVKPQLELTKTAPKKANLCNVIELFYKVKNGGSGDVGNFTVTDSLGEGLATIEGSSELSFPVDGLAAGESREFVARVYAQKPGDFSSRAMAKAENSELNSRSKKTTTKVIAADLIAKVNGPSRIYGDDMAQFTATITNTGNVAADLVNVSVNWPSNSNLVDMGNYRLMKSTSSDQSQSESSNSQGEPTMAKKQDSSKQDSSGSNSQQVQMQSDSFVIERLEAGQSAQFTYAIRTDNLDKLPTKIEARYVCTVDAAEDQTKSTARATAMAMATAKVVRLPALQLAVIDDEDPVRNGSKVQYTINVWNEGDAPDQNVQLVAQLPNNLKFDSADGPTEVNNDGSRITFEPIKSMQPGDRAEYTVTAKPTGTGNARFEAALTSKMLQSEVIGEEPTRLFETSNR
ncbi:Large cysteine-rich periplasmic protein omcB precursor [Rubripirellula obstinata]|uniref:Large cysteine-rich periplasmic protein omcB n=1 Tax=Rubripirellula obstinata TaxID=406547 RepID=A0A5B1CGD6_9BACT|nr:DUF11 domain-containing protein [Rubripirellula obstinata]KAA1258650.1 Large cysteine-rich periplasmic protein omcB precursor [Rubripirellula obstinata]